MLTFPQSPSTKMPQNQSLLRTQEFNFSKKFLWKLPGITPKFHSISPVIIPSRVTKVQKISKFYSLTPAEIRQKSRNSQSIEDDRHKMPQLLVKGTQKLCNKPYFRKTFLASVLNKNAIKKIRRVSIRDDQVIDAWGDYEE